MAHTSVGRHLCCAAQRDVNRARHHRAPQHAGSPQIAVYSTITAAPHLVAGEARVRHLSEASLRSAGETAGTEAGLRTLLPAGPYNPRNSLDEKKKPTVWNGGGGACNRRCAGAARRTQRRASLARGDGPGATCARLQTPDHAARVHVLACMPHRRNWTLLRKRCSSFSHAVSASTRWRPGTGNRRRLSPSRTSWLSPPRNFWPDFCTGIVRLARERPAGLLARSLAPHTRGVQARSE